MQRLTLGLRILGLISTEINWASGQTESRRQISGTQTGADSRVQASQPKNVSNDAQVLPPAKSMLIPTSRSIEMFEERIQRNAKDYRSYVVLGRLYMRQAKENDDFEGYVRAEKAFNTSLDIKPNETSTMAYLAEALMAQHRFKEAEQVASTVVAANPYATLSLATLGDANMQLGNYNAAEKAYLELLTKSHSPPVLVRMARLKEVRGNVEEALKLIENAVQLQRNASGIPDTEGWYEWRLGKAFVDAGILDKAEKCFENAVRLNPDDAASLAGLGFLSASSGDYHTAIGFYKQAIEKSEEPPILTALGDVYSRLGQTKNAESVFIRAEALMDKEAKDPKAGPAHARERALYYVNHDRRLDEALSLAQDDLKTRKDIFSFDTLAWALYKNNRLDEAALASQKAMAMGTKDATLHFHAGMIQLALGNQQDGLKHLRLAVEINPTFSIKDAPIARKLLAEQGGE